MKHDEKYEARGPEGDEVGAVRPEDDVRLTAYALGELDAAERAEVEALLARDAAARAHVDALSAFGTSLERELRQHAAPEPAPLTPAQREAITAAAGGPAPRGRLLSSPWSRGVGAVAAAVLGVGLVGFYAQRAGWLAGSEMSVASREDGASPFSYNIFGDGADAGPQGLRGLGYGGSADEAPSLEAEASSDSEPAAPYVRRGGSGDLSVTDLDGRVGPGSPTVTSDGEGEFRGPGDTVPPNAQDEGGAAYDLRERLNAVGYGGSPSREAPTAPAGESPAPGFRPAWSQSTAGDTSGFYGAGGTRVTAPGSVAPSGGLPPRNETTEAQRQRVYELRDGMRGRPADDATTAPDDLRTAPRANARGEGYEALPENPFVPVASDSRSTFSIDVDTASYANVRRFLRQGQLPPPAAVRIEELVNAFSYDYPAPDGEHPFAVHAELVDAPWADGHKLLRVGLQAALPTSEEPSGRNLVFLVDVSGSMSAADKLPLVQRSLALLVDALRPADTIGIVTYAGNSGIALQPTPVSEREVVLAAIQGLRSGGSTNGAAGIVDAYRLAQEHFVEGGVNRVVLATDGDFNVGVSDQTGLERLITQKRESGVFLSVLGFGQGNLQDAKMETLADKGNGNYAYIDSLREARKVLVRNLDGTLETVAKDVKLQLEFNPLRVQAFRLIGYENRKLEHRDFEDDRKDAGEIGAGHSVTALYELVPVGADLAGTPPLRYQRPGVPSEPTAEAASDEALFVSLRYKRPDEDRSILLEVPVADADTPFAEAGQDTRFAAAVASFGMLLRGSPHAGTTSLQAVHGWASGALGADPDGDRHEFLTLVDWAIQASDRRPR